MAFCGRYLHMQPSEFGALSNQRTRELVDAARPLLNAEEDARFEQLKLLLRVIAGRPVL